MITQRHLLVPTQYYDPETFQVNQLVKLFLQNGWIVTVIAPTQSYPSASLIDACDHSIYEHPNLNIIRIPVLRRNGTRLFAIINSLQFAIAGSLATLDYVRKEPNVFIFAVQYSPFTCILPAAVGSFALNKPGALWICDLWPQSISAFLRNNLISHALTLFLEKVVSFTYSTFWDIYLSSDVFKKASALRSAKNLSILYTWEPDSDFRRLGSKQFDRDAPIRIASIGNLGSAHDIDKLERLLRLSSPRGFEWAFVGGGSCMKRLKEFCELEGLTNVIFHGFLPKESCLRICSEADLSIVPFRDTVVSDTICYRFVSSLSVGTPVISFGENDVSRLVRSWCCGLTLTAYSNTSPSCIRQSIDETSLLVNAIRSQLVSIRTSYRESSSRLFNEKFSLQSAQGTLSKYFLQD